MAKFISTTFGQISGKHGTAVAAQQNGKSILRVYTKPSNPRSLKQQTQRAKFAKVAQAMNPLRASINEGFGNSSGFHNSLSAALSNAITGEFPNFVFNYSKVIVANGTTQKTETAHCIKKTGTVVTADWDATLFYGGNAGDSANLVFYNPTSRNTFTAKNVALRSTAKADITLPAVWAGATIHCWIYFSSTLTESNSESLYINTLTL